MWGSGQEEREKGAKVRGRRGWKEASKESAGSRGARERPRPDLFPEQAPNGDQDIC